MEPNADRSKASESKPGAKPDGKDDLKSLSLQELRAKLGSSPEGLSQAEATTRLAQYGPNEIEEKKTTPLLKFLTYFWGPIPWMIEAAVILSGVVRHWPAVLGTQIVATLIAVYGLFMTPLGWGWALFVWAYALAWSLVNDRVKLLAYRIFDPTEASLLTKKT
jgi:H+-transporting ATPase